MRTALEPEQERVVTPGPQAVQDLLDLPGKTSYRGVYKNYGTATAVMHGERKETYEFLYMDRQVMTSPNGQPWKLGLQQAVEMANEDGAFVPSAPLLFGLLDQLYEYRRVYEVGERLSKLRQDMEGGIQLNTRVNWDRGMVYHYPHHPEDSDTSPTPYPSYFMAKAPRKFRFLNHPGGVLEHMVRSIIGGERVSYYLRKLLSVDSIRFEIPDGMGQGDLLIYRPSSKKCLITLKQNNNANTLLVKQ